jgi:predicted RNase H-like nuclease (RuvC/YqgF family)
MSDNKQPVNEIKALKYDLLQKDVEIANLKNNITSLKTTLYKKDIRISNLNNYILSLKTTIIDLNNLVDWDKYDRECRLENYYKLYPYLRNCGVLKYSN